MEEIYDDGAIDFESNKPFCAVYKECGGGTVERKDIYGAIDIGLHNHIRSFDNRFEVNRPPEPTLVLCWISKFFLFGALLSDTLKIKHTKKLKEIPSRQFLEKFSRKSKHVCLYTSENRKGLKVVTIWL